jgi:hypothetical protein
MNYTSVALAAAGAFVTYFAIGGLVFTRPALRNEFMKYPAVYRSQESMKGVMPAGMVAMYVAMFMLALLFGRIHPNGAGVAAGVRFGLVIAVFSVCAFVIHNHVNLNIGLKLTVQQAIAYFAEWVAAGVAISLIYRWPAA